MTISNFVETYKIHLDRKGENLLIPCVARSQEDIQRNYDDFMAHWSKKDQLNPENEKN